MRFTPSISSLRAQGPDPPCAFRSESAVTTARKRCLTAPSALTESTPRSNLRLPRSFSFARHSAIFVRSDRGIVGPRDLAGKTIGVREFSMTAGLVARGILEDEYGFSSASARWVYGRTESYDTPPTIRVLARGIETTSIGADENLSSLLAEGHIDALIAYNPPSCFLDGAPKVRRLFPDHVSVERDYFRRTGIFPIMHLVAVKRELAERRPEICRLLCEAFDRAKNEAYHALEQYSALPISLPWAPNALRETQALMGKDFWAYGVEANRHAIAAVIRYATAQGLAARPLSAEEIFVPSVIDWRATGLLR